MSDAPDSRSVPPWRLVLGALAVIYGAVLALLNTGQVQIRFVFLTTEISLPFLILGSMGLGMLIALFGPAYWRRRARLRRLDAEARFSDSE